MWWMSSPGVGWVEDTNCKAPLIIQMLKGAIEVNKLLLLLLLLLLTICVVTVRINMANMVAIATLIDICEQK